MNYINVYNVVLPEYDFGKKMKNKMIKPKTVKISISLSDEMLEAIAIESNIRRMNRSRTLETILRENERIKKNIERINQIREREKDVIITAGNRNVHPSSVKIQGNNQNARTKHNKVNIITK